MTTDDAIMRSYQIEDVIDNAHGTLCLMCCK